MKNPPRNIAASVRQRLLNLSKTSGVDYNQLLIRYAIERLLYRLSRSRHRENFVLKGAMLFAIWEGSPHRPTQDVDLLSFGDRSPERIATVFRELFPEQTVRDGQQTLKDVVRALAREHKINHTTVQIEVKATIQTKCTAQSTEARTSGITIDCCNHASPVTATDRIVLPPTPFAFSCAPLPFKCSPKR